MEKIDIINNISKIVFISLSVYFVYTKIINYKGLNFNKIFIALFSSIINGLLINIIYIFNNSISYFMFYSKYYNVIYY